VLCSAAALRGMAVGQGIWFLFDKEKILSSL
jgi:hypothetical protein